MDTSIMPALSDDTLEDTLPGQQSADLWQQVSQQLRIAHGDAVYRSWIKPLHFEESAHGQVTLSAPTRFMREWVMNHYGEQIKELFQRDDRSIHAIDVIVKPRGRSESAASAEAQPALTEALKADTVLIHNEPQDSGNKSSSKHASWNVQEDPTAVVLDQMGAALDPRYTFDNFVVGKPNALAHAAAKRIAESGESIAGCNPLFLYGGVGLGKTHLMHAIAWHLRHAHPTRKVVYLSAEKFMYQFIKALRFNETMAFKDQFRSVDVLMVDDVQFISGKDSTQEEFFHTFNALVDQNKQLVISADRSPSDLSGIEERIRSRLGWGLVADIHTTSYELRYGILESKVEQMEDIHIPQEVLSFLARRITSNIRELEGALTRVISQATLVGRAVTLESTQDLLQDLLRSCDKRINIDDIQKQVADYYNIKVSDMFSARRSVAVARPRQIAMYLSKQLTSKSLPEIGRKFGGKDHTTVMHGVKRIVELTQKDHELREDIDRIQRKLGV